ncbi:MAG: hypothetical protein KA362_18805 [Chloroflexi bacterium]|nr:hypothetical protein [Chloroflexota bacterium]
MTRDGLKIRRMDYAGKVHTFSGNDGDGGNDVYDKFVYLPVGMRQGNGRDATKKGVGYCEPTPFGKTLMVEKLDNLASQEQTLGV